MAATDQDEDQLMINSFHAFDHLPPEVHWFCPIMGAQTVNGDIAVKQEDLDSWEPGAASLATDYEKRQAAFRSCLRVFSYDSDDADPYKEKVKLGVDRNVSRCDACIVGYYQAKHRWMEELRQEADQDAIAFVAGILEGIDIARINDRLDRAGEGRCQPNAIADSTDSSVANTPLCFIDALSCEAYFVDDDRVRQHFEQPFRSFIDREPLRIRHFLPGVTSTLFHTDSTLATWAVSVWSGYSTTLTQADFDFAVRGPLAQKLSQSAIISNDLAVVERLWRGMRILFQKLSSNLVTHSLRAMEMDIFKMSLEHLQYDTPGLRNLLQAMTTFLELAPKDFWESMGTISPLTVIENVFHNSQFERFLYQHTNENEFLKDMIDWIKPFIGSLETVHQAQACRTLTSYLLDKFQVDEFPSGSRIACFRAGLRVIKWTSLNCNKEHPTMGLIGRVVAAELLEVVSVYVRRILEISTLPADDPFSHQCSRLCFDVVELALTLECKCLRTDQETLRTKTDTDPGTCSFAPAIWEIIMQHLNQKNISLAEAALSGINGLTGLEKFDTKKDTTHRTFKSNFNIRLGHFTHLVCLMLERINDFDPADLDKLFQNPTTATGLVATLFSPDASTYEAGVNLLKSISMESARKEAIRHILIPYLEITLDSLSRSLRRIAQTKTYAPCPRMLKTCGDVFDILCDSQNGLLRTKQLQNTEEAKALESFWEHQWTVLTVIYEMTEPWSRGQVAEAEVLKEFVRDTMDLSERIFDQYGIFASAVEAVTVTKVESGNSRAGEDSAARKLLRPPAKTMEVLVKWLRLRETYLASMSVKLTTKVLGRLSENGMRLAKEPSEFVELVVRGGSQGRTNLTPQEKAELAIALERNLGRSIHPTAYEPAGIATPEQSAQRPQPLPKIKKAKDGTIDLHSWRSKSKLPHAVIQISDDDGFGDPDILDEDILSMSRSVEMMKKSPIARTTQSHLDGFRQRKAPSIPTHKAIEEKRNEQQRLADGKAFSEKRKKEIEAKRKRDAETVAMIKKKLPTRDLETEANLGRLGVQGKDHAPKVSGMMLSSESESDPDDNIDEALFGNATKTPQMSVAVRDYHTNRLKALKEQIPVKKTRQVRSAKDMRARLAPNLTSLHKTILGWEYFHNGDFPPGSDRDDYSLVSNTFQTPIDYQNVFEPLLILEAWQGFLKMQEENTYKSLDIKVANRLTIDSFVEVSTTIPLSEGKELGIGEADVILLSKSQSPATDAQQAHCLGRVFKINRKKATMDISYRVNVGNALLPAMVPNATIYGVKILSLTPLEREYGALLGLKYFDLCDEVIKARPSPLLQYSAKQLDPFEVKYKVNTAQAKAIKSAVDNDAFTLIQGPPGSGKTKTIVAIVGALLSGQFKDKGIAIGRPQISDAKTQQNNKPVSKKLLVCAPSNAAVDELVMRFKEGVKTLDGDFQKPSIIRLGRSDAINSNVLDVTLDELVNEKLNVNNPKQNGKGEDILQMHNAHKATSEELHVLRASMDALKADGKQIPLDSQRVFEVMKRKQQQLGKKIDAARDSGDMVARDAEINRRKVQQEILDGAHIICATLSGSGHEMFQNLNIEFESVIIDEAAQSIELSALIPLKYGCAKCILVGDPKQLPPTVLSREAARFQYEQSLFVRMQQNHPSDVHLLNTQYRMHPEISKFPSKEFYNGRLLDGESMASLRAKPWHRSAILGPYRFFDVQGVQQSATHGHSLVNIAETEMALKLFARLTTDCRCYDFKGKVGIITPYKSQLRELRSRFFQRYGESIFSTVEFNTTDAFQGRESEVIIFSCVRAAAGKGIGFLSDIRRMNVGITRAKSSLWVLGNSQSLVQGEFWRRLVEDARSRDLFSGAEVIGLLQKPLLKLDTSEFSTRDISPSSSNSTVENDVEMPDALPTGNLTDGLSKAEQVPKALPSSDSMPTIRPNGQPNPRSSMPSGGTNGLNTNAACGICGSAAHFAFACDNVDAKIMSSHKCHRCGNIDHYKEHCTAERCLECGQFGHSTNICTSARPLSKMERERVRTYESGHKRALQRQGEIQRKKQLGEHGKEVPVVRATSKSPPLSNDKHNAEALQQNTLKRRREPSPPAVTPNASNPSNFKSSKLDNDAIQHAKVDGIPTGPKASRYSLPLRSPTLPREENSGRPSHWSSYLSRPQPYMRFSATLCGSCTFPSGVQGPHIPCLDGFCPSLANAHFTWVNLAPTAVFLCAKEKKKETASGPSARTRRIMCHTFCAAPASAFEKPSSSKLTPRSSGVPGNWASWGQSVSEKDSENLKKICDLHEDSRYLDAIQDVLKNEPPTEPNIKHRRKSLKIFHCTRKLSSRQLKQMLLSRHASPSRPLAACIAQRTMSDGKKHSQIMVESMSFYGRGLPASYYGQGYDKVDADWGSDDRCGNPSVYRVNECGSTADNGKPKDDAKKRRSALSTAEQVGEKTASLNSTKENKDGEQSQQETMGSPQKSFLAPILQTDNDESYYLGIEDDCLVPPEESNPETHRQTLTRWESFLPSTKSRATHSEAEPSAVPAGLTPKRNRSRTQRWSLRVAKNTPTVPPRPLHSDFAASASSSNIVSHHKRPPQIPSSPEETKKGIQISPKYRGRTEPPSLHSVHKSLVEDERSEASVKVPMEARSAEVVHAGYYNADTHKIPRPGPAPTGALPSLPEGRDSRTSIVMLPSVGSEPVTLLPCPRPSPTSAPPKSSAQQSWYRPLDDVVSEGNPKSQRARTKPRSNPQASPSLKAEHSQQLNHEKWCKNPSSLELGYSSAPRLNVPTWREPRAQTRKELKLRDLDRFRSQNSLGDMAQAAVGGAIEGKVAHSQVSSKSDVRQSYSSPTLLASDQPHHPPFSSSNTVELEQETHPRPLNALSPIRVVAEQEPTATMQSPMIYSKPLPHGKRSTTNHTNHYNRKEAFPQSEAPSPSFPSSDEASTSGTHRSRIAEPYCHSQAQIASTLRSSAAIQDLEARFEARIAELERKNTLLLNAFVAVINTSTGVSSSSQIGGDMLSGASGHRSSGPE